MKDLTPTLATLTFLFLSLSCTIAQPTFYVATNGNDNTGDGSNGTPWATITHALDNVPDGSTILVKPGTYNGRVRMRGSFPQGVLVKSEVPYLAKLRHDDRVMTFYTHPNGVNGITIEGLDVAHDGVGAAPLVVHIDGNGVGDVHDITIRNCILHDSYNNDILKINNACYNITVQGNLFFNQTGSDEHIDGNSIRNLIIEDNIFMNDFEASGRVNGNNTGAFIVIKDSGQSDMYTGAREVTIRRNVFLNYQGTTGHNFVLLGEDGNPYYEAFDVLIENNLMLGNSNNTMRAPFGVKGCKNVTFRNNTISGNFPSLAFAFRINTEINNLNNDSIFIYNNIWTDPTGTMDDFSDTPIGETDYFVLDNNLYWNNGNSIPTNPSDLINLDDDLSAVTGDPILNNPAGLTTPHFNSNTNTFADGSSDIREAFVSLVENYGTLGPASIAIDGSLPFNSPMEDILGNGRGNLPDLGAFERIPSTAVPNVQDNYLVWIWSVSNTGLLNATIESGSPGAFNLQLYTMDGQLVFSDRINHNTRRTEQTFDIGNLRGSFAVRVSNRAGYQFSRVIFIR